MTNTTSSNKLPTSTGDNNVDVAVVDQAKLKLNESLSKKGDPLNALAIYDYRTGDATYPAFVSSRLSADGPKVAVPSFQWTLAFNTWQLSTDEDSNITMVAPEIWGIYYKGPQKPRSSAATIMRGFGAIHGLTGPSIAAGAISTERIADVLFLDPFVFGS